MAKTIGTLVILAVIVVGLVGIKINTSNVKLNIPPFISEWFDNGGDDKLKEAVDKSKEIIENVSSNFDNGAEEK